MKIHKLDIFEKYFQQIENGTKSFEVREKRDRNFQVGDVLVLYEQNEITKERTGRTIIKEIIYILDDENFCKKGFAILGLNI